MTPNILPVVITAKGNYTPAVLKMSEATEALGLSAKSASRNMNMLSVSQKGVAVSGFSLFHSSMGALALGAGMVYAAKEAMDFGQQMGNIATLIDTTKESIDDMGSAVLNLGHIIPKPISDMTEALYQIRSGGIAADKAIDVLKQSGILATAGLGSVTNAANLTVAALNDFKQEGLTAAKATDIFFKTVQLGKTKIDALSEGFGKAAAMATQAHVSFTELEAATAALTNTGLVASEAQTQVEGAMRSLIKPTGEMRKLLNKLSGTAGVTGEQFIEMSGGMVGAFKRIIPEAKKAGYDLAKVFGRSQGFLGATTLVGSQNEQFTKFFETMNGGNSIMAAFQKQSAQSAAQFQVFKNGLTELGIRVGDTLLPSLNALLGILNPIFRGISSFTKNHKFLSEVVMITGAVWGLNKYLGITNGLLKTFNYLEGFSIFFTGRFSKALIGNQVAMNGQAAGIALLQGSLTGALAVASRFLAVLGAIATIKFVLDKHQQFKDRMDAITPHLPKGMSRERMEKNDLNNLFGGHKDDSTKIYNAVEDSLSKRFYYEPKARQDSIINSVDSANHMQGVLGNDTPTVGYQSPYVSPQGESNDTLQKQMVSLLGKINEKLNPQVGMQPAYAQNGQSTKRVNQTIRGTWIS